MHTNTHSARKAVVFVMEEFDALVTSGKQTVLYTLVDAMRHTQAQVCVLDAWLVGAWLVGAWL